MIATASDTLRRCCRACLGPQGLWACLFLLFVAQLMGPLIDSPAVRLITSLLFSLFLIAGVIQLAQQRGLRILASLLAVAAIMLRWVGHALPTPPVIGAGLIAAMLLMSLLTLIGIDRVFRDDRPVTTERIAGAVAVYLLFGLTWAYLYGLLDHLLPGAFSLPDVTDAGDPTRTESFTYFSFITLTTLGYGDITPVHPVARMCAVVQALFGQLYPATLLARLVSLEIISRQTPRPPEAGEP